MRKCLINNRFGDHYFLFFIWFLQNIPTFWESLGSNSGKLKVKHLIIWKIPQVSHCFCFSLLHNVISSLAKKPVKITNEPRCWRVGLQSNRFPVWNTSQTFHHPSPYCKKLQRPKRSICLFEPGLIIALIAWDDKCHLCQIIGSVSNRRTS